MTEQPKDFHQELVEWANEIMRLKEPHTRDYQAAENVIRLVHFSAAQAFVTDELLDLARVQANKLYDIRAHADHGSTTKVIGDPKRAHRAILESIDSLPGDGEEGDDEAE